jgi:hypothetical protein
MLSPLSTIKQPDISRVMMPERQRGVVSSIRRLGGGCTEEGEIDERHWA